MCHFSTDFQNSFTGALCRQFATRLLFKAANSSVFDCWHAVNVTTRVAQWFSGQRTWNSNLGTPVRFPGRATIPWASCLLTLPPQFLSSKKLGYKNKFSALNGYSD